MKHYICLEELDAIIARNTLWQPAFLELTKDMEAFVKADFCGDYAKKVQSMFADFIEGVKSKPELSKDEEHIVRAGSVLMEMMLDALAEMENE